MRESHTLRSAAALVLGGQIVFLGAGALHPSHENANHHAAVFAEYAHSDAWGMIHLGQFVGIALFVAGLLVLARSLDPTPGTRSWLAGATAVCAIVTVGLYAVLQAVDGVALKHSVDAWAHAAPARRSATFASAEAVRWLEWGVRSYQQLAEGIALLFVAALIWSTARLPRSTGYLAGLAGLAVGVQGIVIGAEGFSPTAGSIGLAAVLLPLGWSVAFALATRRLRRDVHLSEATAGSEGSRPMWSSRP